MARKEILRGFAQGAGGGGRVRLRTLSNLRWLAIVGQSVALFLVYFALPVVGINLPEFWAGVIALALNAAAFLAEIFRAGLGSIEKGQAEAA
ncbi:MAG: ABC transporter permease subunit, partial [Pseudomonadota bacterium]